MTDKTLPFSLPVEIEKFETFLANRLEEPLPHCVYLILFLPIRFFVILDANLFSFYQCYLLSIWFW